MQIKPTNSNIFFTLHDAHSGDIVVTESHQFVLSYGKVVASPLDSGFHAGDRILINPHAAGKIPTELGDLFVCNYQGVYGIYIDDPKPDIALN